MNDEQDKPDNRYLVTEDERKAVESVIAKLRSATRLTGQIKEQHEKLLRHQQQEVDICRALFEAGAGYDPRPYIRRTPIADDIRKLVAERDEAGAQFERVKTLTQLALGSEPGESILKLVSELKAQIEEQNIERHELSAGLDFASQTEPEQAQDYARMKSECERMRGRIIAPEKKVTP